MKDNGMFFIKSDEHTNNNFSDMQLSLLISNEKKRILKRNNLEISFPFIDKGDDKICYNHNVLNITQY